MSGPLIALDGRLIAYRRGGIERYVSSLATHLPREAPDLDIRLLTNRSADAGQRPGWQVRTPPHHRLERLALGIELGLRRPDVIHSPDFIPPMALGTARVITVHDLAFLDDPSLLDPSSRRYYGNLPRTVASAARVIAVSEATRRQVLERLRVPEDRVVTVPNGVDDRFFDPAPEPPGQALRRDLDPPALRRVLSERPIVLAVGTVEPRKRYDLLMSAMDILSEQGPTLDALLVIAGHAGWQCDKEIGMIMERERRGDAIWVSGASDVLLHALYRTATLLAMPSRDEGFGLPAAEAMASGLPVLVAANGALPEIVGAAGICLADDRPEAWAAMIERLIQDNTLRAVLALQGRDRARAFNWARAAARTADVYREVLKT